MQDTYTEATITHPTLKSRVHFLWLILWDKHIDWVSKGVVFRQAFKKEIKIVFEGEYTPCTSH